MVREGGMDGKRGRWMVREGVNSESVGVTVEEVEVDSEGGGVGGGGVGWMVREGVVDDEGVGVDGERGGGG